MKAGLCLICILCCAIALGACGGDDSDGSATADGSAASVEVPAPIEGAIAAGLAKRKYSLEAAEATAVEANGSEATVELRLSGDTLDGQSVEAVLSRGKEGWELDELTKFIEFDEPLLVENYEKETKGLISGSGSEKLSVSLVDCLVEQFEGLSQEEMESMYLDRDKEVFLELGKRCTSN